MYSLHHRIVVILTSSIFLKIFIILTFQIHLLMRTQVFHILICVPRGKVINKPGRREY
jgi:hypothetical protein